MEIKGEKVLPVGLWAQAWRTTTLPSLACSKSRHIPSRSTPIVWGKLYHDTISDYPYLINIRRTVPNWHGLSIIILKLNTFYLNRKPVPNQSKSDWWNLNKFLLKPFTPKFCKFRRQKFSSLWYPIFPDNNNVLWGSKPPPLNSPSKSLNKETSLSFSFLV